MALDKLTPPGDWYGPWVRIKTPGVALPDHRHSLGGGHVDELLDR